jgi:hypothetical protein
VVSLSELADHFAGASASCWRASSVSDSLTKIATWKRVVGVVGDTGDKVPHVKAQLCSSGRKRDAS